MNVDVGRVDVFVSEPQGDDGGVDSGVQQPHGGGVAKRVRGDGLFAEGWTGVRGRGHMCREALRYGVAAERLARPRGKDRRVWYAGALGEPRPQGCGHRFGERRDSLLAPFRVRYRLLSLPLYPAERLLPHLVDGLDEP